MPKRGDEREHLWVVLTEADSEGNAVCVNITRKELYSDTTVVLKAGDHPYIHKESVVHYPDAQKLNLYRVEDAIEASPHNFICKRHRPCSEALLERIRDGLLKSPHTPKGIKAFCKALWEVDLW